MRFTIILLVFLFASLTPCDDAVFWKSLLQHKIGKNAQEKIDRLDKKGNFHIQTLDRAGGKLINLDYFPITIKTFPKNPKSGFIFTPEEFLKYLRLNFNDFVNKKYARFSPSQKTGFNEDSLWKSANPVGAVIHIHIPLPAGDGSVICTEFDNHHWVYATLHTPWRPFSTGCDGKHPVSGFRQVGFTKNNDGSYTYYTKGVDKMTSGMQAKFAETFMKNPFKDADKLWESLRDGIFDFVEKNGGDAISPKDTPAQIFHYTWKAIKSCTFAEQ